MGQVPVFKHDVSGNPTEPPPLPTMATRPSAAIKICSATRRRLSEAPVSMSVRMSRLQVMGEMQHNGGRQRARCHCDDVGNVEATAKEIVRQRSRQPRVTEAELQELGEASADLCMLSRLEGNVHYPPCRTGAIGGRCRGSLRRGSEQAEREGMDKARQPRPEDTEDRASVKRKDLREQHGMNWIPIGHIHKRAQAQCEAANCHEQNSRRPLESRRWHDRVRVAGSTRGINSMGSHSALPEDRCCTHAAIRVPL